MACERRKSNADDHLLKKGQQTRESVRKRRGHSLAATRPPHRLYVTVNAVAHAPSRSASRTNRVESDRDSHVKLVLRLRGNARR
jgi:hypothetical protein